MKGQNNQSNWHEFKENCIINIDDITAIAIETTYGRPRRLCVYMKSGVHFYKEGSGANRYGDYNDNLQKELQILTNLVKDDF